MDDWRTIAEWLLRSVAPDDLRDVPIYLIDQSELPEKFHSAGNFVAYTHRMCDGLLAEYLTERGEWRGFGFAAVFCHDQPLPNRLGTCLHELAHWIDFGGAKHTDADLEDSLLEFAVALRDALPDDWLKRSTGPGVPPWQNHGADFVRAAAHLAYRAEQVLASVRPKNVAFASPYHQPPYTEAAFMDALDCELRRSGSIRDILSTDPPNAFTERWRDATGWFDREGENAKLMVAEARFSG